MKKIFLLALILSIANFSTAFAHNWKYLYTDDTDSDYFIDEDSLAVDINNGSELMYHAIFKEIYSDEGRRVAGEIFLRNNGWLPPDHDKISHSVFLEYFMIEIGRSASFSIDAELVFTFDGSIINELSYSSSYHHWKEIVEGNRSFYIAGATLKYLYDHTK